MRRSKKLHENAFDFVHVSFLFDALHFTSIYYVYLNQQSIYMTQMHSIPLPLRKRSKINNLNCDLKGLFAAIRTRNRININTNAKANANT